MKKLLVFLLAMMAMVVLPSFAQEVNMSRYITLTVKSGKVIKLDFKATQANTPVRIVSGGNTKNIIVNNTWYTDNNPYFTVTADGTTITIYGDIVDFNCSFNRDNLTSLDVSKNPQLTKLYCYSNQLTSLDVSKNPQLTKLWCEGNKFTTESMNELYCSLPEREEQNKGVISPVYRQDDANHAEIVAATSDNARKKNWDVRYKGLTEDVPSKGNYKCK